MRKSAILAILFLLCMSLTASAQLVNSSQMLAVALDNVIEISFANNNSTFGELIRMQLTGGTAIESPVQEIKVRTNKAFNVNVKSKTPTFEYKGEEYPAPQLPVDETLSMKVVNNNTGGSSLPGTNNYFSVTQMSQSIITGGGVGGNQNYGVKYRAKANTNVPEGTYAVDLIYTASQE